MTSFRKNIYEMEVIEKWDCCPFIPLYEYRKMVNGWLDTQNENYAIDMKK